MVIDFGYATTLEELQSVVENLTDAIKLDYSERVGDRHFDPSIVVIEPQVRIAAHVELLTDGSAVYNLHINAVDAEGASL